MIDLSVCRLGFSPDFAGLPYHLFSWDSSEVWNITNISACICPYNLMDLNFMQLLAMDRNGSQWIAMKLGL